MSRFPTEKNWDSYGAKPTTPEAIKAAEAIEAAMKAGKFSLVPTIFGGVQIEGHSGVDWEFEIGPAGEQWDFDDKEAARRTPGSVTTGCSRTDWER